MLACIQKFILCNFGVKQQSTPPDERELSCIFFGKGQFSNFNPQGQALRVFGGISTPFASLRVVFHQKNLVDWNLSLKTPQNDTPRAHLHAWKKCRTVKNKKTPPSSLITALKNVNLTFPFLPGRKLRPRPWFVFFPCPVLHESFYRYALSLPILGISFEKWEVWRHGQLLELNLVPVFPWCSFPFLLRIEINGKMCFCQDKNGLAWLKSGVWTIATWVLCSQLKNY